MTRLAGSAAVVGLLILGLTTTPVLAHPLGNFTINHYTAIDAHSDTLTVAYVLDMAEIPTFQEIGHLDQAEMERHLTARLKEWSGGLRMSADGVPVPLTMHGARVSCLPGVGGLPILRIEEDLRAGHVAPTAVTHGVQAIASQGLADPVPHGVQVVYRDTNFTARTGWKEIVVTGREVLASSMPATDRGSDRLRAYPVDLLKTPPGDTVARFTVQGFGPEAALSIPERGPLVKLDLSGCRTATGAVAGDDGTRPAGPRYVAESTAFGALFERLRSGLTLPVVAVVLAGAFALGAYHALTPGHGKGILAAYFIGSRGTPAQAVLLGTTVTLTHTSGVFLLGFATLAASRYVPPETLYPWLSLLSGVLLSAMGASLFWRRVRALRRSHTQGHDHDHGHAHAHPDDHERGHRDQHLDHRHHAHGYAHDHHSNGHAHGQGDPHGHHHHVPMGETVRARDLITLGVTGGLLPCPSALVVMLAAMSAGQVGFGLALITAFSLGLAAVLTAGGLLMVYSRAFISRVTEHASDDPAAAPWRRSVRPLLQRLPLVSAAVVAVLGLVIVIQAVLSMGPIR